MRKLIRGTALLAGACIMSSLFAWGQNLSFAALGKAKIDAAVLYHATVSNTTSSNRFSMQGGSVQLHGLVWHDVGAVAEVSGLHAGKMGDSSFGLTMVSLLFGPRYTWSPANKKLAVFGQALGGVTYGMQSLFPSSQAATDSSHSGAVEIGGGFNVAVSKRFSVRAFEADWLQTRLPNGTSNIQNNLRLGAGLVWHIQ